MDNSTESLRDIQTIQSLLQEYELALKKSNGNIETLKERICELMMEQKEYSSKMSNQQIKHNEEIKSLKKIINVLNKENGHLLADLTSKYQLHLEDKENNHHSPVVIDNKKSDDNNYNKNIDIIGLQKENEMLKKKMKKSKEDLKNELNDKITFLQAFEATHASHKEEICQLKEKSRIIEDKLSNALSQLAVTIAEMNLWKKVIIDISKHRLKECDHYPIEQMIQYNKQEADKAPIEVQTEIDKLIQDLKNLYDDEIKELANDFIIERSLRRKAYHRYMSLRGNLRTLCRIRPLLYNEANFSSKRYLKETFKPFDDTLSISTGRKLTKYEFDYVFTQRSSQQDIYDEVSMLVKNLVRENNICIIAYGQTNSGKTYSIEGPIEGNNHGIVPKAVKDILTMANEYKDLQFNLSLTIIEIYNDIIYNLLDEAFPLIEIFEGSNNEINMPNLNPIQFNTINEANELLKTARKYRIARQNLYNERSSRSHCIYTFYVQFIYEGKMKQTKLHFVDLAGSERLSKSYGIINDVLKKESQMINLSLNSLANVLNAIALKKPHIPFRDCKLTHFLKESLMNNFNILLMLHISPNSNDIDESICTLDFGSRFCKLCKYKTGQEKTKQTNTKKHLRSNSNNSTKRRRSLSLQNNQINNKISKHQRLHTTKDN